MASIVDDRGYNQGFKETKALVVRTERRRDAIIQEFRSGDQGVGSNGSVLEIGCGTGLLSKMLFDRTPFSVTGIDLCQEFVDEANQKYASGSSGTGSENLKFLRVDLSDPVGARSLGKFDYIVGNGILHHLYHHLDTFLLLLKAALNPSGKIVFWEPNLYNPYVFLIFKFSALRKMAKLEPDEMAFTGSHIRPLLARAGFKNIRVCYRDFLLPNTPDSLIGTLIKIGEVMESSPLTARAAQSLFVVAET